MEIWQNPHISLRAPGRPANLALVWRVVAITLIPVFIFATAPVKPENPIEVIDESAAGMLFQIQHNRVTGEACLIFSGDRAPKSLQNFLCP